MLLKERFEKFKAYVKDHKKEIAVVGAALTATIVGAIYVCNKKQQEIEELLGRIDGLGDINDYQQRCISDVSGRLETQEHNLGVLKDVVSDTVIGSMKDHLTRKLRYNETKLANAIRENNDISVKDKELRMETIKFCIEQLRKCDEAIEILSK